MKACKRLLTTSLVINLVLGLQLNEQPHKGGKGTGAKEFMTKETLFGVDWTALCNDGSPPAYYWKKSPTNSTRWVIYLGGGGLCYDQASCQNRWDHNDEVPNRWMMSSKLYADTDYNLRGIFSPNKNESVMWDANKVQLLYCTSDLHMGQVGGPDKAEKLFGKYFRGRSVINALFKHLMETKGLGDKDRPPTVVFGGGSAGAVGAMYHLDHLQELLKPSGGKVLGMLDAPLDFQDLNTDPKHLAGLNNQITKQAFSQFEADSFAPNDCKSAYGEGGEWKCFFAQYRLKYLKTPFILLTDLYDFIDVKSAYSFNTMKSNKEFTLSEKKSLSEIGETTRKYLENFDFKHSGSGMIYGLACGNHAVSAEEKFYEWKSNGTTTANMALTEALDALDNNRTFNKKYMDYCPDEVMCNSQCRSVFD